MSVTKRLAMWPATLSSRSTAGHNLPESKRKTLAPASTPRLNQLHLFEFGDQPWLPSSLKTAMQDVLQLCFSWPIRGYNEAVATQAQRLNADGMVDYVIEMAAGCAPLTKRLAQVPGQKARLIPCDAQPNRAVYRELGRRYAGRVLPQLNPIDMTAENTWPKRTLVVVSAAFHHVPPQARLRTLARLCSSADQVMICEPLCKGPLSFLLSLFSWWPTLLAPLLLLHRPGRWQRFVWCWLLPIAPILITWDGCMSCLRQWSTAQWQQALTALAASGVQRARIDFTMHSPATHSSCIVLESNLDRPCDRYHGDGSFSTRNVRGRKQCI